MRTPMLVRYWSRVARTIDPDSCWLWEGTMDSSGYGQLRNDSGRIVSTHRTAWMLEYGEIPPGVQVLHQCDSRYAPTDKTSRRCVNPLHLWLGDNLANVRDRVHKGRQRSHAGEANPKAKLTADNVRVIRADLADGVSPVELARRFGVTHGSIWFILNGVTWQSVA